MEYYFKPDDKLDRLPYAKFLESLIRNSHLMSQKDNGGSFVIALNASWGTGKTRFSLMFRNFLLNMIQNPALGAQNEHAEALDYNVVYYNSWETDFWSDALDPLLEKIVSADAFQLDEDDADLEELKKAALEVLKGTGYAFLKHIIGDSAVSIIKDSVEVAFNPKSDPLQGFKQKDKQINDFKKLLTRTIEKTHKKLVILVDELDRCKPTFAIQTLEFVKHLFDIDQVVFVFALDIGQLSSAASAVYGNEMDAAGYLCRFFDYIGELPSPNVRNFVTIRLQAQQFYHRIKEMNLEDEMFEQKIVDYVVSLAEVFSLSLRDLDSILSAYEIVTRIFLRTYLDAHPHMVYLFLLTLKNKDVCLYGQLFSDKNKKGNIFAEVSKNYDLSQWDFIETWLKAISNESAISDACFPIFMGDDAVNLRNVKIKGVVKDKVNHIKVEYAFIDDESGSGKKHYIESRKASLGRVLYFEDLIKWDQIRELTLHEYYYQQLEMFNFALLADETETQT